MRISPIACYLATDLWCKLRGAIPLAKATASSIRIDRILDQTCRTSMLRKDMVAQMMGNRWLRQNVGWRHNESESCETIIKNNSTTEVSSKCLTNLIRKLRTIGTVPTDVSSAQSDRSQSPSTMSEEGRRDLIARQHRALYGGESSSFLPQGLYGENDARENNAGTQPGNNGQAQGNSPPAQDLFRMTSRQGDGSGQSNPSLHEKNRMDKTASPSTGSGPPTFGTFEPASQQSGRNPTPPSSGEGHSRTMSKSTTAPVGSGMGPIGSRPNAQQGPAQGLNKRTTSPLPNQPLSYGSFGTAESTTAERTASSNSNSNQKDNQTSASGSSMGAWGTGSGVWGSSNKIGTTSVWG